MSMFDEVRCERLLPDGLDGRGVTFQTKDIQDWPTMTLYTITDAGRLVADDWHYEGVPPEERDYPGIRRVVDQPAVDQGFDGELVFYEGFNPIPSGGFQEWHEYRATFRNGSLVEIATVEVRP